MNGYRPKFTKFVTKKMQNLLSRCWSDSPKERPIFKELFETLSKDTSFFFDFVDEEEIQEYIDILAEKSEQASVKNEENKKIQEKLRIDELEPEVLHLKKTIQKLQDENKSSSVCDCFLNDGFISILGQKRKRNITNTIHSLKTSSSRGNSIASFIVGILYEIGEEVEQDMEKSFKYYERSFKQGNTKGFYRIGRCYDFGSGTINQDFSKAKDYYEKASELGDECAMNNLGALYEDGKSVEQDYTKAKEYYEKVAELGNPFSIKNLGYLHEEGKGVKQD